MIPLTVPETGRLLTHPPPPAAPRTGWTGGAATSLFTLYHQRTHSRRVEIALVR